MTLKELATLFGMSIEELSEYTGYTRQALYSIIANKNKVNEKRFKAMIRQLKIKALMDHDKDKREIEKRYNDKLDALDELENSKSDTEQILELYSKHSKANV